MQSVDRSAGGQEFLPEPARDEVLVAVHAAAITFTELTWDETWGHRPAIPSQAVPVVRQ